MNFSELDKQVSREIQAEFKGQVISMVCPICHGATCLSPKDDPCDNCGGTGTINRQY